jgi:hypothetical protein
VNKNHNIGIKFATKKLNVKKYLFTKYYKKFNKITNGFVRLNPQKCNYSELETECCKDSKVNTTLPEETIVQKQEMCMNKNGTG